MLENFRKKFPFSRLISNKRVYIIPSQFGLYFLILVFLLFILSISFGNSLAYAVSFLLVSSLMSIALITNNNLKDIDISFQNRTVEVSCKDFLKLYLFFFNSSKKSSFFIKGSLNENIIDLIEPNSSSEAVYSLSSFDKRGVYLLDNIKIFSEFPFGLFKAWKYLPVNIEVIVTPAPKNFNFLYEKMNNNSNLSVKSKNKNLGADEFYQIRKFAKSDRWNKIIWSEYSRSNTLYVSDFIEAGNETVLIDFNLLGNLSFEEKLSQIEYFRSYSQYTMFYIKKESKFHKFDKSELAKWLATIND